MQRCKVLVAVAVAFAMLCIVGRAAEAFGDVNNITARYQPPGGEHFQFNTRIPKKPFTKKNNFLSFDTKNNNIEVCVFYVFV